MSALEDARAEAYKRYDGDTIIDENTGEPTSFDDWGYAETARRAFVAGVEWLLTAPPTTDERYKGWHLATWDGDKKTTCTCGLMFDHPIEQTTIALLTDDALDVLIELIDGCIPDDIPGYRQRYTNKAAEAILAAGFRCQGPITDAYVDVVFQSIRNGVAWRPLGRDEVRAALEAARTAQ